MSSDRSFSSKSPCFSGKAPPAARLRSALLLLLLATFLGNSQAQTSTVGFTTSQFGANEDSQSITVLVTRSGDTSSVVMVTCSTVPGTAQPGVDFVPQSEILTFPPGQTQLSFTFGLIDNGTIQNTIRTVHLELSNPTGASLTGTGIASVDIYDNETAAFLDPQFTMSAGPNDSVFALAALTNGTLYIGGEFTSVQQSEEAGLIRLLANGSVDYTFDPVTVSGPVYAIAVQTTGDVIAGGSTLERFNMNGVRNNAFNPAPNDEVRALVIDGSGRLLVGGRFTEIGGQPRSRLARLDASGVPDSTFTPTLNGNVRVIATQPDGRILVGGQFTMVNDVPRARIARLNANGSLDMSFDPGIGADGQVRALAVQGNGQILVGGEFQSIRGESVPYLARLNSDGTLDNNFTNVPNSVVRAIALQGDGRILVGGNFTEMNGVSRSRVARLLVNGDVDDTFLPFPSLNNEVFSFALLPNGSFYIGGQFTTDVPVRTRRVARVLPNSKAAVFSCYVDSFYLEANFTPLAIIRRIGETTLGAEITVLTADGTALGGSDYIPITNRVEFAPLQTQISVPLTIVNDGMPEASEYFLIKIDDPTPAALFDSNPQQSQIIDNDLYIGFTELNVNVDERASFAELTVRRQDDGTGTVAVTCQTMAAEGDARPGEDYLPVNEVITFTTNSEVRTIRVPILNNCRRTGPLTIRVMLHSLQGVGAIGNGSMAVTIADDDQTWVEDLTFLRPAEAPYWSALQTVHSLPDGRILVPGTLSVNGTETDLYSPIARLHPDGSLDTSFRMALTNYERLNAAHVLAVAPDGAWAAGFNGFGTEGFYYGYLGIFPPGSSTGRIFTTSVDSTALVRALAWQGNDKLLIGGNFGSFAPGITPTMSRLLRDGSADASFHPPTDQPVYGIAVGQDGKIVCVRGMQVQRLLSNGELDSSFAPATLDGFYSELVWPLPRFHSVPLIIEPDGKVLVGGRFTGVNGTPRPALARLNVNGTLDTNYVPIMSPNTLAVSSMELQADGKLLLSALANFGDVPPLGTIVRLEKDGGADPLFNPRSNFWGNYAVHLDANGRALVTGADGWPRRFFVEPPVHVSKPEFVAPGSFHIFANSILGDRYVLQSSTDLLMWQNVVTNTATACTIHFTNSSISAQQFFRVAPQRQPAE